MFHSILAATDISEASDPVLRAAAALAKLTGAELHVLHVIEVPGVPYAEPGRVVASVDGSLARARAAVAEQLARAVPEGVVPTSVEVVLQSVHAAILERVEATAAELIVLGPHRLRPFGDRFLGSTADRVIRTAPVPCLLVREPLDLPLRRVMVPTDLSEHAGRALDAALQWVGTLGAETDGGQAGAEVQVVHIVPRVYEMPDFAFDQEVVVPELERLIRQALEHHPAGAAIREQVFWGDLPADEVLRTASREHVDLLVIGTHGHGSGDRALLGSVASSIARGAPCPVLLVPPSVDGVSNG
jgi:nucleotide-binding universal stress UspA family protein